MNYANFYSSAEKMLIDSLVSLWFKGKGKEQEYMRNILTKEEPLLAEPVFQSIFPWENSNETFGEHASKLNILSQSFVNALSSESIDSELRFPLERHPYKHQTESWKTMLSGNGKTIVVTSGTGSGKTECFMIPVLQDIAQRNEKDCVQAIFIYPLNALMKSQQKRIHAWCDALPEKITYAIYNGDTEKAARSINFTSQYYPQLITRPQIRQTPPQVLFTNPTMLNYMLVRAEDKEILEKSKGKLKWILLDEAHTYTGSSAAELSLQLRRVLDAFGVTIDQVNFAVTSATIGDEKDPATVLKLKTFVSQLTGKPIDSIVIIGGKRIIPEMDKSIAETAIKNINDKFHTKIKLPDIERLRNKLNSSPVLSIKEIAKQLDRNIHKDKIKALELIDELGNKIDGLNKSDGSASALLPTRAHFFIRSISGIYVCTNQECNRHKKDRLNIGNITTYQNTNCPICKSRMLEITTCPSCGGIIVVGETSTSQGFRMRTNTINLDKELFYEDADLIETDEEISDSININKKEDGNSDSCIKINEADGFSPFYLAKPDKPCLRHHTFESNHVFNHLKGKIEIADDSSDNNETFKSLRHFDTNIDLCPHCGNRIGHLNYLRASATQLGRILSTLILDNADASSNVNDIDILYEGKKYITFTDNRQGSARSAMGINQDVERAWIRSSIFHKLADIRLDNVEDHDLTEKEKANYELYKSLGSNLPEILKSEFKKLEAKKNGSQNIPKALEVLFSDIIQPLENNADLRKLFKHLNFARGIRDIKNVNEYLIALIVDQFGWIPKRSNSLENMGFVHLVYPNLKSAKCPELLLEKGCDNNDWQNFLKICIDYLIRGGRHYMISDDIKPYLTQNRFTSAIYPMNSNLKRNGISVSKWPSIKQSLKGVQEEQPRLILLLCAVLEYNNVEELNDERIASINSLLSQAWSDITSKILECTDIENKGYMLNILGPKVRLQLLDKGYLCPVDNVIVDVTFCGYSPRMNGYLDKNNFDRFKVEKEFSYPCYPFKSTEQKEDDVNNWINDNLSEQINSGIFSDIHQRIYAQKPIFIAAEHSAQQSREDLDRFEKEFNNGYLNILSCSTTMEMGVDIGGITEVVMNNVPPKSANYLQRTGRAGRRSESKALALTFCAPNPIGTYTWKHPEYPMTHITETPLLKLESRQLIQRHVNALIFADFVSVQGGIRVTSKVKDFFIISDEHSYYDLFLNHIDNIINGQKDNLEKSYRYLVKGTALDIISLGDAGYTTKKDIISVYEIFNSHIDSLNKSLDVIKDKNGMGKATRAITNQKENFLNTSLLSYFAENSFLPSAGIPTGLVECMLDSKGSSNYPTMHLSQAISAYAPENQIIKNEWIYEPTGIRMKTKYNDSSSRYILQNCSYCGYTTINPGNAMNDCPKCGHQNSMHGIKNMSSAIEQRFTEVVEPAAFTVDWDYIPTRKMKPSSSANFIQPVLLEMDPWEEKTSSAKMTVRCSTTKSEILFYNRGNYGFGYALCPYCGKMQSESTLDSAKKLLVGHRHLTTGAKCPGGESDSISIRRHVLLVGRYQTDFVEIKFFNAENIQETDTETLYSLGVILSRKLTELLGINDGEIDFGYNGDSHTIFIYDTALGGAGYSPLFREYKDTVLEMAYNTLQRCNCERSCTSCLIDRRSQWYMNYLNRQKALQWLELERKSRIAPDSIAKLIADATAVTTDFATEFYQLARNKDLKNINVFLDNDISTWQPNEYPFSKLISELYLAGVDVSFILKTIDITKCSSSDRAILLSAIIQYKNFKVLNNSSLASILKPLLSVTFNDGNTRIYFGEDIKNSLSSEWGNGDVFASKSNPNFSYSVVNVSDIINNVDDSIMFDIRIKKRNMKINSLLNTLINENIENWEKIQNALNGKKVTLKYTDRYLHSPLGCMLLAHLISNLKKKFNLSINNINISVTKPPKDRNFYNYIDNNFDNSKSRNQFLNDAIFALTGIYTNISDVGYVVHERCLSLETETEELCIRPDGGVAHGWKADGYNATKTDFDFQCNWNLDINLNNQNYNNGILYTVSYKKK